MFHGLMAHPKRFTRWERELSRQTISVWCLILCTAVLWGAWLLQATVERPTALPDLRLWPFQSPRAAAAPQPVKSAPLAKSVPTASASLPAEKMPFIRVGLLSEPVRSLTIEVSEAFVVRRVGSEKVLFRAGRIGPTTITASASGLCIGKREPLASPVEIVSAKSPAVWVEGHQYRGTVRLYRQGVGGVMAVNVLPLEDYLASVIDSEMPVAFPLEARKAQAIVARTYALYQQQIAERAAIADLSASTRSQKYLGYQYREGGRLLAGESEAGRQIAAATRGAVCHYRGKIFCTYYCAVCGGSTVPGTEVFSDAAPPLKSVKCDFCRDARLYRWTAEISRADMQKELEPWFREKGWKPGTLKTVSQTRSNAKRSTLPEFDVRSEKQSMRITGSELRQILAGRGLYSPRFTITDKGPVFEISGRGHGHGVGLCQWGARGLALEGRTSEQILGYYYPGSVLVTRVWKATK